MNNTCAYCDPDRKTPRGNSRGQMCPDCREDYDCYLEDKAEGERDERRMNEE
jgi:hypothetical protein